MSAYVLVVLLGENGDDRARVARIVVTPRRIVVDDHVRVVHDPPSPTAHRPRRLQVVADLRALAAQEAVKGLERARADRHVGPLEEVDVLETRAQVMVADAPPPPGDAPDPAGCAVVDPVVEMDDVAPADGADAPVGGKAGLDARDPIGTGAGVVIGDGDDLALGGLTACVERCDLTRIGDRLHPSRPKRVNNLMTCRVVWAQHYDYFEWCHGLAFESRQAGLEALGTAIAWYHY